MHLRSKKSQLNFKLPVKKKYDLCIFFIAGLSVTEKNICIKGGSIKTSRTSFVFNFFFSFHKYILYQIKTLFITLHYQARIREFPGGEGSEGPGMVSGLFAVHLLLGVGGEVDTRPAPAPPPPYYPNDITHDLTQDVIPLLY